MAQGSSRGGTRGRCLARPGLDGGSRRARAAEASDASVGGFTTSGAIVITRWPSTDSVTPATVHVFPSRTSVSPTSGTRSVITYSQTPDGKRMVMGSAATTMRFGAHDRPPSHDPPGRRVRGLLPRPSSRLPEWQGLP
jgi:hypothetical protein